MKTTLLIFFLLTGIPACVQFKQRHDLEERTSEAARSLHNLYVLTPNQTLRIVYANAWMGNVCVEYVADDAREQSFIRYAVLEKNSKVVEHDLYEERHRRQMQYDCWNGSHRSCGEGVEGNISAVKNPWRYCDGGRGGSGGGPTFFGGGAEVGGGVGGVGGGVGGVGSGLLAFGREYCGVSLFADSN